MTNDILTCICPTFRQPRLLSNLLALWHAQDFPADRRRLVILDDAQTFASQRGDNWELISAPQRFPSLPAKYNHLLTLLPAGTTQILVWETDDRYLERYISRCARVLDQHELCKPRIVLSDYSGRVLPEEGTGRFHSSLGFRRTLIDRIGGWPKTLRADFDQIFMGTLFQHATSVGDPWSTVADCQYVMGWHTGHPHGQGNMSGPADETWYAKCGEKYPVVPYVGQLKPAYDDRTAAILRERVSGGEE